MNLDDFLQDPSLLKVEVINPETPFGGVQIFGATDTPIQIEFNTGSPVLSVFGRIGNVTPLCTDYDQCYAPLIAAVPVGGTPGQVLTKFTGVSYEVGWVDAPATDVDFSDFARLSLPNVFQRENTFRSIRTTPRVVNANYDITHLDGEILVDAGANDVVLTLPLSDGTGQNLRIKRIDNINTNAVTVVTQGSDVMDYGTTALPVDVLQAVTLVAGADNFWELGIFIPPFILPSDLAHLASDNFFTNVNSLQGIRLPSVFVSSDYTVQPTDFAIYVLGATGDVNIQLPPALADNGRGQYLRIKKLDNTDDVVAILADGTDLIDGSVSVNLTELYAEAQLLEAAPGRWDNTGSAISGGGGEIAETTNLLAGDGFGAAVDSGIDPARVVQVISPLPARPTTLNETIALLQSYGLCA